MSIDIVNLIKNNPIAKLNGDYQSKLIENVQKPLIIMNSKCF